MPSTQGDQRSRMEVVGLGALAAGAVASVAFTFAAGLRAGSPRLLLVLFAAWVAFPFAVFFVGHLLSRRGSRFVQRVYSGTAAAVSLGSAVAYAVGALLGPRPITAVFVLAAPLSLLLVGLIVPTVVFVSRKRR